MLDAEKNTYIIGKLYLRGTSISLIHAKTRTHKFIVVDTPYTRLCSTKNILTVNGQFPGPTIHVTQGDTIFVDVINKARENITIHWHGVKMPRYPWTDGPEWITQCPIRPGTRFNQKVIFSNEVGTVWWHAHSDWSRATVHGVIVVHPKKKDTYPFPKPHGEIPIVLGEWWKSEIPAVLNEFEQSGGDPNNSDAYLINGQPGDLYPCSKQDTFKIAVEHGKTYLIKLVNAAMNTILFYKIANHSLTVVGTDGAYTKPFKTDYITIAPGQTIDFLLQANQPPSHYYMAARAYSSAGPFDNTTTTAVVEYDRISGNYTLPPSRLVPSFPDYNDTLASTNFTSRLRSLGSKEHPINVPMNVTTRLMFTISLNLSPCENQQCAGPFDERFLASLNNVSFDIPKIDILQAYYGRVRGVYGTNFPSDPPREFNYTANLIPRALWVPVNATKVKVLEYNSTIELVIQGTNIVAGIDHPMHLHGYSFYVVGSGSGNFNPDKDPLNYNLIDPPLQNTITVAINGWAAIRFVRDNGPPMGLIRVRVM